MFPFSLCLGGDIVENFTSANVKAFYFHLSETSEKKTKWLQLLSIGKMDENVWIGCVNVHLLFHWVSERCAVQDSEQDPDLAVQDVANQQEIEDLFDELEDLSDSGPDMDTISVLSTPKPKLR